MEFIVLGKYNLLRQMRGHQFIGLLLIAVFVGFLCVPGATGGYEVFYLGGVRSTYNSPWLGALSATFPVILLWLPGFYLLRSKVTEDRRLNIGQIIAATPMSKLNYISGKVFANFVVLMALDLLFTTALMAMQLLRGERYSLGLVHYLLPFLYVTVPHLLVLAALTVLFDVAPGLGGAVGNISIFLVWVSMSTLSLIYPGTTADLFGMGYVFGQMLSGARMVFPSLPENISFGYYIVDTKRPTFDWAGMTWDASFLLSRLAWMGVAVALVLLSALLFDRFKKPEKTGNSLVRGNSKHHLVKKTGVNHVGQLSPVKRASGNNLFSLTFGELKMALSGRSILFYVAFAACIPLSVFVAPGEGEQWIALIMLLPMAVWSQMGCRGQMYATTDLILASCYLPAKWFATWLSGIMVALFISAGMIVRFIKLGDTSGLIAWMIGTVFVVTLALVLSSISGTPKVFEGVYIALFYLGPINGMPGFDFLGLLENNSGLYLAVTIVLLALGLTHQVLIEKRIINYI